MQDPLDDGAQPRCATDGVVMRDIPGGWECPACGWTLTPVVPIHSVPRFSGPSIRGG